jgi:hypothetical protein
MISRETGETQNEADLGAAKDIEISNPAANFLSSETLGQVDGSASNEKNFISSTVLSDVELYKISFK